jgi:hypothetical protein
MRGEKRQGATEESVVMMQSRLLIAFAAAVLAVLVARAPAWDAYGHRLVTRLAVENLPEDMPQWLRDPAMAARIADQSVTPDRWRGTRVTQMLHVSNPDHYFNVEDLDAFGMTLRTMPHLRMEFIKAMVESRIAQGDAFRGKPINPARDADKTQEWPGFLPHAICEQYGRVQAAMRTIRTLEAMNNPARSVQLEQAKADLSVHMGIMAHYVGDTAQPLHTTKHHHGWVGENPNDYTTDWGIHAYIDGGVVNLHKIDAAGVLARVRFEARRVNPRDPWGDVLSHVERSFEQVETVYVLKKTGELEQERGKAFIETRLADAAETLRALYIAAWVAATPVDRDRENFERYDNFDQDAKAE